MKRFTISPVLRYLVLILAAVVVGINVYTLNASRLTGDALPMPFGYGASVVLSGSMEPELSVGDLLIVQAQESYQVNDVVVYQSGRTPVVHRIIAMDDEKVTTQGDANNTPDEPFYHSAIKGEVIAVIPLVGYGVWALKSPVAVIIMLALAVLMIESSFRITKEAEEAEKEAIKEQIRSLMEELKDID